MILHDLACSFISQKSIPPKRKGLGTPLRPADLSTSTSLSVSCIAALIQLIIDAICIALVEHKVVSSIRRCNAGTPAHKPGHSTLTNTIGLFNIVMARV